jgi:hypothetical protein
VHARRNFLSDLVTIEDKGSEIQISRAESSEFKLSCPAISMPSLLRSRMLSNIDGRTNTFIVARLWQEQKENRRSGMSLDVKQCEMA